MNVLMRDRNEWFEWLEGVETRWVSPENPGGVKGGGGMTNDGRKGRAWMPIQAGETIVLAEHSGGSGVIRRIWVTISDRSPAMLRSLRLDFYWDGADKPAVSAPFGDFFGTGLGRLAPFQSALFSNPEGKSFNCSVPMPFRTGMKLTITNEGDKTLPECYYDVNYTVGDRLGDQSLYFHACYRRENPTSLQQDYEFLPRVEGKGRFLGVNVGVICNTDLYYNSWWGEGECKIYVDGDSAYPTLCGTGTEDYIGTAWGQGQYDHLYQGCHIADYERMQYCFYRYHILDPIYFSRDIRVTMQQMGSWSPKVKPLMHESGRAYFKAGAGRVALDLSESGGSTDFGLLERQDDWSSCAYFYLNRPTNELPPLDPISKRIEGLV